MQPVILQDGKDAGLSRDGRVRRSRKIAKNDAFPEDLRLSLMVHGIHSTQQLTARAKTPLVIAAIAAADQILEAKQEAVSPTDHAKRPTGTSRKP
jgi:hypothetical protein